jgi:hypothetical protein
LRSITASPIERRRSTRRRLLKDRDSILLFHSTALLSAGWEMPKIDAVVDVHQTRQIKDEIRQVGGPFLCLPFLTMGPAQHVAVLDFVSNIWLLYLWIYYY